MGDRTQPLPETAGCSVARTVERIGLHHRQSYASASREADHSHALRIDEGLASKEEESPVGIRPAPEESRKRARCAGVVDATRCIAVDEQDDIAPSDECIGKLLPRRLVHPSAAVQADDGGNRARAGGLGQLAPYALAGDAFARNKPLRGALKLHALQRCGPGISRQRRQAMAQHQHDCGLEGDRCRQCRLLCAFARGSSTVASLHCVLNVLPSQRDGSLALCVCRARQPMSATRAR